MHELNFLDNIENINKFSINSKINYSFFQVVLVIISIVVELFCSSIILNKFQLLFF